MEAWHRFGWSGSFKAFFWRARFGMKVSHGFLWMQRNIRKPRSQTSWQRTPPHGSENLYSKITRGRKVGLASCASGVAGENTMSINFFEYIYIDMPDKSRQQCKIRPTEPRWRQARQRTVCARLEFFSAKVDMPKIKEIEWRNDILLCSAHTENLSKNFTKSVQKTF